MPVYVRNLPSQYTYSAGPDRDPILSHFSCSVETELRAQIDSPHFFIGRQRVGCAAMENSAIVHDIGAIGVSG